MVLELFNIQSEGAEYTNVNYPAEIGLIKGPWTPSSSEKYPFYFKIDPKKPQKRQKCGVFYF